MATRKENFVFCLRKEIRHFCSRKRFKTGMSVRIGPQSESLLHFISSERRMTDRSKNSIVFLPNTSLTQPEDMPQKFHCLCTLLLTYREANSHSNLKFLVIFIKTVKMGKICSKKEEIFRHSHLTTINNFLKNH